MAAPQAVSPACTRTAIMLMRTAEGEEYTEPSAITFHIQTRLPDGRPALIVDPGSVGNLCGDKWAREVAIAASRSGHKPSYTRRARPLQVSGVGHGAQACKFDCKLPIGLRHASGQRTSLGELTVPSVQGSDLPGLLGKLALKTNRAVWDFVTDTLYFMGPGDYELDRAMPPGTDKFQLETAPSGHSVLPCCEYTPTANNSESTLTLVASSGGMSTEAANTYTSRVPPPRSPPPAGPPVLPIAATRVETMAPPPGDQHS